MRGSERAKTPSETTSTLTHEEPIQAPSADDTTSDKTAVTRFPSEPASVTTTHTQDKVAERPKKRPRRNYNWLKADASKARDRDAVVRSEGGPRDPADVAADALAHAPRGDRPPPIVRVREVRRDYEYHYEYVYEEEAAAPYAAAAQAPALAAPQAAAPRTLPPAAEPMAMAMAETHVATRALPQTVEAVVEPQALPIVAPKLGLRTRLAAHAGPVAIAAVGLLLVTVALAFVLFARSGSVVPQAGQATVHPPTEAPVAAPLPPPPVLAAPAAPTPEVAPSVASAAAGAPSAVTPPKGKKKKY